MKPLLSVVNLHVAIENKKILKGVDLSVDQGKIHAIMGPNGSGKSSLAYSIMGHPSYLVTKGTIEFEGQRINDLSPDKRAKLGIFLAMQHPIEIEGIKLKDFLRQAYNNLYDNTAKQLRLKEFTSYLNQKLELLGMGNNFVERMINVGFSGGEKKRAEILQLAVLQPKLAILDEIDSGLDIDALKTVCNTLNSIKRNNPELTILLITHYKRILNYLKPDFVHVLRAGQIVRSGESSLANELEKNGYE